MAGEAAKCYDLPFGNDYITRYNTHKSSGCSCVEIETLFETKLT